MVCLSVLYLVGLVYCRETQSSFIAEAASKLSLQQACVSCRGDAVLYAYNSQKDAVRRRKTSALRTSHVCFLMCFLMCVAD